MVRLTRRVFTDLAIWMMGLGLAMGLVFPFFVILLGVPSEDVLSPVFFAACVAAGLTVGAVNIRLARAVVGERLSVLAQRMRFVEGSLQAAMQSGSMGDCTPEHCRIVIDSEDEIGESARAFNQLVEALSLSLETASAVRTFTDTLASQLEVDVLAEKALEQLVQHTGAAAGAILIDVDGQMNVAASQGLRSPDSLISSEHVRRALRTETGHSVLLPDDITVDGVLTDFCPREALVEPVVYKESTLGVIILAGAAPFRDEDRSRLQLFRQGLALALQNALAHERLQRLAALDPLTGAYNRRFGLARLREEFRRAARLNSPVGVLMFDLDHFKDVNDTYGHLAGDQVLVRIARAARTVIRDGDILVRYGGEEFLAILPAASLSDAAEVSERLRRVVQDTVVHEDEQEVRVTISVGATAYPEMDVADETALVQRADRALYRAKDAGRNRVVMS